MIWTFGLFVLYHEDTKHEVHEVEAKRQMNEFVVCNQYKMIVLSFVSFVLFVTS